MSLIAQMAEANPLAAYGLTGLVLAWMMWFIEKLRGDLKVLAHRIDGLTRALLLDLVSRDNVGAHSKAMAHAELAKVEKRE